jgi:SAM-dependent methyltransferase
MVEVDYVVKSPDFADRIEARFDLVIANHVIEHVPDPIRWLRQVETVTSEDGSLFLSVPDRRYTFDYLRPESTLPDLLRAHEQRLERADYYQVLSSLLYHRPVRAEDAWSGRLDEKLGQPRFSVPEAMRRARFLAEGYAGIHCHVFTRESFERLFRDLAESGLVGWRVAAIDDVPRGRNEFHVVLRRESGSA